MRTLGLAVFLFAFLSSASAAARTGITRLVVFTPDSRDSSVDDKLREAMTHRIRSVVTQRFRASVELYSEAEISRTLEGLSDDQLCAAEDKGECVKLVSRALDADCSISGSVTQQGMRYSYGLHLTCDGVVVSSPSGDATRRAQLLVRVGEDTVTMCKALDFGLLKVRSIPTGAAVEVDGETRNWVTPLALELEPGRHTVKIRMKHYKASVHEVRVSVRAPQIVEARLEPLPTSLYIQALDRATGIEIRGARVFIDQQDVGVTPFDQDIAAGPHEVRIEHVRYASTKVSVTTSPERHTRKTFYLQPRINKASSGVAPTGQCGQLLGRLFDSGERRRQLKRRWKAVRGACAGCPDTIAKKKAYESEVENYRHLDRKVQFYRCRQ